MVNYTRVFAVVLAVLALAVVPVVAENLYAQPLGPPGETVQETIETSILQTGAIETVIVFGAGPQWQLTAVQNLTLMRPSEAGNYQERLREAGEMKFPPRVQVVFGPNRSSP
jgi:hypothetical protein